MAIDCPSCGEQLSVTSEEDEGGIDVSIWCEWCAYGGFVLTLPSLKKRDLKLLDGVIIDVKKTISNAWNYLEPRKAIKHRSRRKHDAGNVVVGTIHFPLVGFLDC